MSRDTVSLRDISLMTAAIVLTVGPLPILGYLTAMLELPNGGVTVHPSNVLLAILLGVQTFRLLSVEDSSHRRVLLGSIVSLFLYYGGFEFYYGCLQARGACSVGINSQSPLGILRLVGVTPPRIDMLPLGSLVLGVSLTVVCIYYDLWYVTTPDSRDREQPVA